MNTLKNMNLLVVGMSLMGAVLCSTPGSAADSTRRTATAVAPPVLDGVLDDACWQSAPTLADFYTVGEPETLHPQQTRGWVCYDDEYLYAAVECAVDDMETFGARMADSPEQVESGLRLYVDWRNARKPQFYEEYQLDANGMTGYIFSPGNPRVPTRPIDELNIDTLMPAYLGLDLPTDYVRSEVSYTEDSYVIEAAIPFAMMHLDSETAKVWAFTVRRIHDQEAEGSATDSFWGTESSDLRLFQDAAESNPRFQAGFGDLVVDADLFRYYWGLRLVSPKPGDRGIRVQLDNKTGQDFSGAMELTLTRRAADSPLHTPDGQAFTWRQQVRVGAGQQTEVRFAHQVGAEDVEARYQLTVSDTEGRPVIVGSTSTKDNTPGDEWAPPAPTAGEAEVGYLVYSRPYTVPMTYRSVPRREEVIADLSAFGAPGEYVPVVFSLYPLQDADGLTVTVSDLSGPGEAVIPATTVDVRYVEYQAVWQEKWIAYSFKSQENLLRHFDSLNLTAGRSRRLWLTAKLADGQQAGRYTGTVALASGRGQMVLPLELEVLPFKLADVDDMGYFMYADGALTGGPEMARKVARDMREHGMTTTTVYYIAQVGYGTDEPRLVVDEPVGYDREAGRYVVAPDAHGGMSYAQVIDILVEEGFARKIPLIDMYSAGMSRGNWYEPAVVARLDRTYKERGWPQVLYYLVDEPESSAKRVRQARARYAQLRSHGLRDLQFTTAVVGRDHVRDLTNQVVSIYDVWILLHTGAADLVARGLAEGREVWTYGCSYSWSYGTADLRHYFGRYLWKSGLKGASLWQYNWGKFRDRFWAYPDRTEVAFDPQQHYLAFSYVWQEEDEIIPTVKWEAIREGIDDHRYLRTLQHLALAAATASDDGLRAAGKAGLDLLDEIRENVARVVEGGKVADDVAPFAEVTPSLAETHAERKRVVEAILAILEAGGTIGPQ